MTPGSFKLTFAMLGLEDRLIYIAIFWVDRYPFLEKWGMVVQNVFEGVKVLV